MRIKKSLIVLIITAIFANIYSCSKDNGSAIEEKHINTETFERGLTVTKSETFEMTANNEDCYMVTIKWMSDNSVVCYKELTNCSANAPARKGVYFTEMKQPDGDGKIKLDDGYTYWYVPLTGTQAMNTTGAGYSCFCETQRTWEQMEGCQGQGECIWEYSGFFKKCNRADICCEDCDLRACLGRGTSDSTIINRANGIIIRALSVTIKDASEERNGNSIYYGNNIKLELSTQGNTIVAIRSVISGTPYPRKLVNLTTLTTSAGRINLPSNRTFWFIPFESKEPAIIAVDDPECRPDDTSCTECELKADATGCYQCYCKEGKGTGDCDMVPSYAIGGVLVEASQVQITDLQ